MPTLARLRSSSSAHPEWPRRVVPCPHEHHDRDDRLDVCRGVDPGLGLVGDEGDAKGSGVGQGVKEAVCMGRKRAKIAL